MLGGQPDAKRRMVQAYTHAVNDIVHTSVSAQGLTLDVVVSRFLANVYVKCLKMFGKCLEMTFPYFDIFGPRFLANVCGMLKMSHTRHGASSAVRRRMWP